MQRCVTLDHLVEGVKDISDELNKDDSLVNWIESLKLHKQVVDFYLTGKLSLLYWRAKTTYIQSKFFITIEINSYSRLTYD